MDRGASRYDLRKHHRTLLWDLRFLPVTVGTFIWASFYALVLLLWWELDRRPEPALLFFLVLAGVLLVLVTLEYSLSRLRARRQDFQQVMKAYNDYMETLLPANRVGSQATTLFNALMKLRDGLGEPEDMVGPDEQPKA